MADTAPSSQQSAAHRLARMLGLPAPAPLSKEQEQAYQEWMRRGDERAEQAYAGRAPRAA